MKKAEFAAGYSRFRAQTTTIPEVLRTDIESAESYALRYGTMLHEYLSDESCTDNVGDLGKEYTAWHGRALPVIERKMATLKPKQFDTVASRLGFHCLNLGMQEAWWLPAMSKDPQFRRERHETIDITVQNLALDALSLIISRAELSKKCDGFPYFTEEYEGVRGRVEGVLSEIDAAIVSLTASKTQDFNVVVAPPQFERGMHSERNSDLIAIGCGPLEEEVIGLQVKSLVKEEDMERYDPRYVLLLCSDNDLDNIKGIELNSSMPVVSWNGQISVEVLRKISFQQRPRKGKKLTRAQKALNAYSGAQLRDLMLHIAKMRELEGKVQPRLAVTARRIGDRVVHHLQDSALASQ